MKHKKLLILLIILLFLLFGAGGLYLWQRENIKAISDAGKYTNEEIEQQLEESRKSVNKVIEENKDITVRDLNDDEKEALKEGTLTEEELIEMLTHPEEDEEKAQQTTAVTEPETESGEPETEPEVREPTEEELKEQKYQRSLAELIARIYILRQEYTNTLEGMAEEAKTEYSAKSESDKTTSKLIKWAAGYITRANELEKECDAQMDGIIAEMKALIAENNGSTDIIDTVIYSYANEKSLKKSWYLSEMKKRGLV